MKDNLSNFHSDQYDNGVRQVIPYYPLVHQEAVAIVRAGEKVPETWIDTGCGTGHLVSEALLHFSTCRYLITDPSEGMLEIAAERFSGEPLVRILEPLASEMLPQELSGQADVVSAMFCHHYQRPEARQASVKACFRCLKEGGVYITAGHCLSDSDEGRAMIRREWRRFQEERGRTEEEIDSHFARFGEQLFPLTLEEHTTLLKGCGFRIVELFWRAGMQCAFFAIR